MLHDPDQHGLQRGLYPLDLFVFPHRKQNRPFPGLICRHLPASTVTVSAPPAVNKDEGRAHREKHQADDGVPGRQAHYHARAPGAAMPR